MLPGVVKTFGAQVLHWAGADRWRSFLGSARDMPMIVGYHRVVEDFHFSAKTSIPAMLISSRMFERHLDLLAREYQFVSLDQLAEALEAGRPFDRPVAAVTFDDGYSDVYQNAFPILWRKGIPAAVFVVTGLLGTSQVPIHDRLYQLLQRFFDRVASPQRELVSVLQSARTPLSQASRVLSHAKSPFLTARAMLVALPQKVLLRVVEALERRVGPQQESAPEEHPMTWEMLLQMHRAGITVGSHTRTHPVLTNESCQQVHDELNESRRDLESRLGVPVLHLAYPDGRFSAETVRIAAAVGYRYAYTICQHQNHADQCLTIPRRILWENSWLDFRGHLSPAIMNCQLNGLFDFVAGCTQDHHMPRSRHRAPANLSTELTQ